MLYENLLILLGQIKKPKFIPKDILYSYDERRASKYNDIEKIKENPKEIETSFLISKIGILFSHLHNYFNLHVCPSLRRPVPSRPSVRPTFEFPIPAGV